MSYPKISAVIPTYRRPALLKKAIASILNQTMPDFKICIYDDASGDETRDVCESFKDDRIHYFCHPKNLGIRGNHQFALERIDTPYFSFLSDDDLMLPCFYAEGISALKKYPEAACFAGATKVFNEKGKLIKTTLSHLKKEGLYKPEESSRYFFDKNSFFWISMLMRREVIQELGTFDFSVQSFEVEYAFRILIFKSIVISKKTCTLYTSNPIGNSFAFDAHATDKDFERLICKFSSHQKELVKARNQSIFGNGIHSLINQHFERAQKAGALLIGSYGGKFSGCFLYMTAWFCRIPIFHRVAMLLLSLRRLYRS